MCLNCLIDCIFTVNKTLQVLFTTHSSGQSTGPHVCFKPASGAATGVYNVTQHRSAFQTRSPSQRRNRDIVDAAVTDCYDTECKLKQSG